MFRRSGSFVAFQYSGRVPEPASKEFAAALKKHRFRTIEDAASEESSVGWVTPIDPTGDSFEFDEACFDDTLWLRMRMDKKTLPQRWVMIYRAAAERSKGKKLSPAERRELKSDLADKLLPRILPTVAFVDALLIANQSRILLFATAAAVREHFMRLFEHSFEAKLELDGPQSTAQRAELDRAQRAYLREVTPVKWPSRDRGGLPVIAFDEAQA